MCALGAVLSVCTKVLVVSILRLKVIVVGNARTALATARRLHDAALAFGRKYFGSSCVVIFEELSARAVIRQLVHCQSALRHILANTAIIGNVPQEFSHSPNDIRLTHGDALQNFCTTAG